jgi:hypothetical protein
MIILPVMRPRPVYHIHTPKKSHQNLKNQVLHKKLNSLSIEIYVQKVNSAKNFTSYHKITSFTLNFELVL